MDGCPVDVFEYLDYRSFLHDFYHAEKKLRATFSYRSFARRAGIRSPNYLKLVMEGQRKLSGELAPRFARACGLDGDQVDFFCELRSFAETNGSERRAAYARILAFKNYKEAHATEAAHADYCQHWYIPAIRELISRKGFREQPSWIAKQLRPVVTARQVQHALRVLNELGLVEKVDGKLRQSNAIVTTGPEPGGVHVHHYHREMLELAAQSMDSVPAKHRDISSITVCVNARVHAEIKQRLQRFRREILELAEKSENRTTVLQLNLQMFPISDWEAQP